MIPRAFGPGLEFSRFVGRALARELVDQNRADYVASFEKDRGPLPTGGGIARDLEDRRDCRWQRRRDPSSKSIRLRKHYCTRNTIFPSRCPASRRLCASAALASGYSAAIGTCSFAASTALFRRSNSPLPETKL